jgi:hypothetical protein
MPGFIPGLPGITDDHNPQAQGGVRHRGVKNVKAPAACFRGQCDSAAGNDYAGPHRAYCPEYQPHYQRPVIGGAWYAPPAERLSVGSCDHDGHQLVASRSHVQGSPGQRLATGPESGLADADWPGSAAAVRGPPLADADAGKWSVLVVWAADRLSREGIEALLAWCGSSGNPTALC